MIHTGDCVEVMAGMDAESVDAIVTDPPYGLEFMGKEWDRLGGDWGGAGDGGLFDNDKSEHPSRLGRKGPAFRLDKPRFHANKTMQEWHTRWATEAYRVAKPGAHLLAFGGTRTSHRLASAIEDAGWEIRDCLVWAYASGFPKSLDVSKAIDKAAGVEREKVAVGGPVKRMIPGADQNKTGDWTKNNGREYQPGPEVPATDAAKRWQGWGTALKPAWEPIVMARKPLRGTVAANVQQYGTGALNIDGTRIGVSREVPASHSRTAPSIGATGIADRRVPEELDPNIGRWPPNLLLTDPLFDGGVDGVVGGGTAAGGHGVGPRPREYYYEKRALDPEDYGSISTSRRPFDIGDTGTYSRFFLIPKAARSDREPVLRGQLAEAVGKIGNHGNLSAGDGLSEKLGSNRARENLHPTVKPVELMRHLVRLVTPPGGIVLDCFLGSGSTAIAAEMEGFAWIGIEKEPEYVAIAEARLVHVQRGMGL
jgi:DNA modification methylase